MMKYLKIITIINQTNLIKFIQIKIMIMIIKIIDQINIIKTIQIKIMIKMRLKNQENLIIIQIRIIKMIII
jgi:hypothetical protein